MPKLIISKISSLLLLLFCLPALGQNSVDAGQYQINYIAYNSTFLEREVAKLYKITRAKNMAVVNISVQDNSNEGKGVEATVSGTATNILHQIRNLTFRKVNSGDAIYYIADYRFDEGDVLTFKLDVTVPDATRPTAVEWQQKFWKQ